MQQITINHACPQHHATGHGRLYTMLQHRTVSSKRMIQEWSTHLKHLKPVDVQNSHHFGSLVPSHLRRKPENCSLAYKPWCIGVVVVVVVVGGGGGILHMFIIFVIFFSGEIWTHKNFVPSLSLNQSATKLTVLLTAVCFSCLHL